MNLDNELKLAKLAAKNAGIFLIKEKVSLSKTIYSQQKDIKLDADIQTEALIKDLLSKDYDYTLLGS